MSAYIRCDKCGEDSFDVDTKICDECGNGSEMAAIDLVPVIRDIVHSAFEEGCSENVGGCNCCTFHKDDGSDCVYWKNSTARRRIDKLEEDINKSCQLIR